MNTLKVKPWSDDQGEFVVIDEDNFDESKHELYEDDKKQVKTAKTKKS